MTNIDLLNHLNEQIECEDWERLAAYDDMPVSMANRAILLQMRDFKPDACKSLSAGKVRRLEDLLSSYLNQYMEDRPDWHKWIIMVCLFRAFVAEEPLHPREAVNYRIERTPAGVLYYCPVKETGAENICSFCPARKGGGA